MQTATSSVTLDGAHGEGGGALVRTALVMSALTQQSVEIFNVRGATRYPGLDVEDTSLIGALQQSTSAIVEGAALQSERFTFAPQTKVKALNGSVGDFSLISVRHPNALVLLNALQGVLAHAGAYSTISAEGETFGNHTLSYDAFAFTTVRALMSLGLYSIPSLMQAGFGREAKGQVDLEIEPSYLEGVNWTERGLPIETVAIISYSQLNDSIPSRAASHLESLSKQAKIKLDLRVIKVTSNIPGFHVTIAGTFEHGFGSGSLMGTRSLRVESVVQSAFEQYFDFVQSKAAIDSHLADQILIPCIFAHSPSTISVSSISQRLMTSVWVAKQFMPLRITLNGGIGNSGIIAIQPSSQG